MHLIITLEGKKIEENTVKRENLVHAYKRVLLGNRKGQCNKL